MRKKNLLLIVLAILVSGFSVAQAQDTPEQLKSNAVEMRGDASSEEISVDEIINKLDSESLELKSEDAERSVNRFIEFDNWTNWYIRCYINGNYQGTVAPWSELRIRLPRNDVYRFYAEARFEGGVTYTWGGVDRFINGPFQWSLYD